MGKIKTIGEICNELVEIATKDNENKEGIFALSFRADEVITAYKIYNENRGFYGKEINDFDELEDISFNDTAVNEETTLLGYMEKFQFNKNNGDGELVVYYDSKNRVKGMFAIHNTNLGPALGGLREANYTTFDGMLTDTLRLARTMTYKAAAADTKTGGGKATRLPPEISRRKEANLSFARLLNFIAEKRKKRNVNEYITAEDVNTHVSDFDDMFTITDHVGCRSPENGGSGNPSPITAIGVYHAAKAGAEFIFSDKKLEGKVALLTGVGQCGYEVLKNFLINGYVKKVICIEPNTKRIDWVKKQLEWMNLDKKVEFFSCSKENMKNKMFLKELSNEVDIFSPCALGPSITDENISYLKNSRIKLICGSENNQLADEKKHGEILHEIGILYIPDFIANAGGLINCVTEIKGRNFLIENTIEKAKKIEETVREIIKISKEKNIPTYLAADHLAENRFLNLSQ